VISVKLQYFLDFNQVPALLKEKKRGVGSI
jgi:hypothetical protein